MLFVSKLVKKILPFSLVAICLCLFSCSIHSIGKVTQLTDSNLRKIDLPKASSRNGQLFRQKLEHQIGTSDKDKQYLLRYSLTEASRSSLSASGSSSILKNTKMSVNYSLEDNETGEQLTHGSVSATATSGTITSYYGNDVSEQFASERLVGLLAERMYQKLQLYFLSANK